MQRRVGLRRIEALEISRVSRLVMENTQSAMQRAPPVELRRTKPHYNKEAISALSNTATSFTAKSF